VVVGEEEAHVVAMLDGGGCGEFRAWASPTRNSFCLRLWPVSPHSLASPYDRLQFAFEGSCSHRTLHSRAVVSVVALRLERALAVVALVLREREAQSSFVARAAAFAASSHSSAFVSVVALRFERALATFGSSVPWQHSVRACLGNWCTVVRHAKLKAGSCCHIRCIQFEYIRLLSVLMLRTCCKR
jgi:hypothetical protein